MKSRFVRTSIAAAVLAVATASSPAADKKAAFDIQGTYIEGCSCHISCGCDLTGPQSGCAGVNIIGITSGTYQGVDLSGGKIAVGTVPGSWVRLFTDGKPEQQAALQAFGTRAFQPFGKIESVAAAKIDIKGSGGAYRVSVNGGKTLKLSTKVLLGGDKKTPVVHSNMGNPITSVMLQGQAVSGSFNDGNRSFEFKNSNAYFQNQVAAKGKL